MALRIVRNSISKLKKRECGFSHLFFVVFSPSLGIGVLEDVSISGAVSMNGRAASELSSSVHMRNRGREHRVVRKGVIIGSLWGRFLFFAAERSIFTFLFDFVVVLASEETNVGSTTKSSPSKLIDLALVAVFTCIGGMGEDFGCLGWGGLHFQALAEIGATEFADGHVLH